MQLIATERFNTVPLDIYGGDDAELYMTREQIGRALEYSHPQKAIDNIHQRFPERLGKYSVTLKLRGADGKFYDTTIYNRKGIMEICRHSRQPKADAFIDFAWDVIDRLARGELVAVEPAPADFLEACGVIQPAIAPSDEAVARHFLQAINGALRSGEYYLLRKYSRGGTNRTGSLLGIYDDDIIMLICAEAYKIWRLSTGSSASARSLGQTLRPILTRSGLVLPRARVDEKQTIKRVPYCVLRIPRQTANRFSGAGKAAYLLPGA